MVSHRCARLGKTKGRALKKLSACRFSHLSPGATGWNMWQLRDMLTPGRYVLSAMTMASVLTYHKFRDRSRDEIFHKVNHFRHKRSQSLNFSSEYCHSKFIRG